MTAKYRLEHPLKGASVSGKILEDVKGDKEIVFKKNAGRLRQENATAANSIQSDDWSLPSLNN